MEKIGKYKILGILGKGGMGIVYKAVDPDIERTVAIKTIRFDSLADGTRKDDLMARFVREARAVGKISHPNIITIYDVGRENDLNYIVMQFIEGQSLQALIDSGKIFSPEEVLALLKPLCDAIDFAHENGIIHRDIKPANFLLDGGGKPYLADFGVAQVDTSTMTQSGTAVGTLSYMSPEQITGQKVSGRADIFALGIVIYELLTGKRPFTGDSMSTLIYKIVNEAPPPITEINRDLPQRYEYIIQKALAKSPDARYPCCRELVYDIENAKRPLVAADFRRKRPVVLLLPVLVVLGGTAYFLFSPKSGKSLLTPPGPPAAKVEAGIKAPGQNPAPPPDEFTARIKESLDKKNFKETIKLAEEVLAKRPDDPAFREYWNRAKKAEDLSERIAPLLQSAAASYQSGNCEACLRASEKALALDRNNSDALKYAFLADTTLAKADIQAVIARHLAAEEKKDLLAIISQIGQPALASRLKGEYKDLFNWYDEIKSSITNLTIDFSSRVEARAKYSQILTAVYKKDGIRKKVFEGNKIWHLRRSGKNWQVIGGG